MLSEFRVSLTFGLDQGAFVGFQLLLVALLDCEWVGLLLLGCVQNL